MCEKFTGNLANIKRELRGNMHALRIRLAASQANYAHRIASLDLFLPNGAIVGGYAALPGEADPRLLLKRLEEKGYAIALPRVVAKDAPLSFHLWHDGQPLAPGAFGVPEPSPDWPAVAPRVLLVPLLAFDRRGHRLGYGGGYYDRTLAALRAKAALLAIGIAYAGQEVAALPAQPHDQRLDGILTENGFLPTD